LGRFWSVLFWSVIAAAFIGPGTVTAAASAGSSHGYSLLWALLFSSAACLLLQEASARITVVSGRDLGQALRRRHGEGLTGLALLALVLGAIVFGCAAYEVGNVLGGVSGAALESGFPLPLLTLGSGFVAALLLWFGAPRTVARLLSLFVAVMGVAFLITAWRLGPPPSALLSGALVPRFPEGSGLLVLGLVGTTVVPYNLFLGSGLARGQSLPELRFGLSVAVLLGGLISMAILVTGAAVQGEFGFGSLAAVLGQRLGEWARYLFATGLFVAGLSSAITAPLAAAITARSLFSGEDRQDGDPRWNGRSWRFRAVWLFVLGVGVGFGLAGVRPIPAILLAQALNGILLPLVALFLLLAVNDRRLMGASGLNGPAANLLLGSAVAVTVLLGAAGVGRAACRALGRPEPDELFLLLLCALLTGLGAVPVWRAARRGRAERGPGSPRPRRGSHRRPDRPW
jgi:Mn2+/Fe2+ NRAMP family transporter